MATIKKAKKWNYHVSHSYIVIKDNVKGNFQTQLYQTGVYGIINGDSAMQFNLTPNDIVKIEKNLKKDEANKIIKDLVFGREITVIEDIEGFYKEISE